ncbi:AraC-like DNA-binding protein [Granulicella aggregans]|uniref:AraC-like DNA-binding protein n=2 Tax=Granulicella aggregans TaxID=474949 RepID=A0A7W7ZIE9_9BACT|nr:AraC-like DNA-binding protein [Granulicella aggregans]
MGNRINLFREAVAVLKVQSALPHPPLRRYIRSYVQRESGPVDRNIAEPVVARLGVMLEFQFGRHFEVPVCGSDITLRSPEIGIIGPMSQRTYCLIIRDHVEALTVLFRPQGFHAVFGIPTLVFADLGIEGHSVLGSDVSDLFEKLGNTKHFPERVILLDHFLTNAMASRRPLEKVHRALNQLIGPEPTVKIFDVAAMAGMTVRQLERRSLDYTGLTPKMLVRIARFQRALRMKSDGSPSWAEIAHQLNYFDQMHMIRDFKAFTGDSPGRAIGQIATDHLISL